MSAVHSTRSYNTKNCQILLSKSYILIWIQNNFLEQTWCNKWPGSKVFSGDHSVVLYPSSCSTLQRMDEWMNLMPFLTFSLLKNAVRIRVNSICVSFTWCTNFFHFKQFCSSSGNGGLGLTSNLRGQIKHNFTSELQNKDPLSEYVMRVDESVFYSYINIIDLKSISLYLNIFISIYLYKVWTKNLL